MNRKGNQTNALASFKKAMTENTNTIKYISEIHEGLWKTKQ